MQATHRLHRGLAASLLFGFGLFRAWDSGALSSPCHVLLQTFTGALAPPGAVLLSKRGGVWVAVVAGSAVLSWIARWTAPRTLPAVLLLIGVQAAVLYLVYQTLRKWRGGDPLASSAVEVQA